MPRSVPAGIIAKQNAVPLQGVGYLWLLLVEIHFASGSVQYFSSAQTATFEGNVYAANRVREVSGLVAPYIDRKRRDFGAATITLDNLASDSSNTYPITALEGSIDPADAHVFIHLYEALGGDGVTIWHGYVKDRQYNSDENTVTVQASYLWDSPGIVIPSSTLQQNGFAELETGQNKENLAGDTALPMVWGVGEFKIRPTIYHTRVRDSEVQVNCVLSGTGPVPFSATDLAADRFKLFDITPATRLDFHRGLAVDTAPVDKTMFPDLLAHNNVAYFSMRFPTDAIKDKLDNFSSEDMRGTVSNGRPLITTGAPSGNLVAIIEDALRDPLNGMGMAAGDIDDLSVAKTTAGTRWQARIEMHEQVSVGDWIQNLLAQMHGYVTFNGRKLQIGIKSTTETPVVTFATLNSGQTGRRVHGRVRQWFESSDQAKNQVNVKYRLTNRHQKELIAYDNNAQGRAGGTIRKVEKESIEFNALYQATATDNGQVAISAATLIREEQNCNLFIGFSAPLPELLDVTPGDLIRVWSEDISNNATNNVFRVVSQPFDNVATGVASVTCQVYFATVYNYSTAGIGIDLIRGNSDISSLGRPPDVTAQTLALIEKVVNDAEGQEAHMRGAWTYPAVDLAGDLAAGIARDYPIQSVLMLWRYLDEGVNEWKFGKEVKYPTAFGDFNVPYLKSKTVQVMFIALGLNRSYGSTGYVPDPTRIASMTIDRSATDSTFVVTSTAPFEPAPVYAICEFEIFQVVGTNPGLGHLGLANVAGVRTPQFDTQAVIHAANTQIAVAKQNYPVANLSLTGARFNYPAVGAPVFRQRKEAVKVKIPDVSTQNLEDYFTYITTDAAVAADVTKLGSTTPAWYLANPLAPPVGITVISRGKALHFEIPQEDLGGNGVIVFGRIAARNGKNNWSSALSPLASNSASDDAIPIAAAPKLIIKKRGVRARVIPPALNVRTLKQVDVVVEAKDAGGASLGFLSDSTGLGDWQSSVTEFRFNLGLQLAHTFLSKGETQALWPTAATLKIRCYLTNDVGTSAASADSTVTVATWEVEGSITPGALAFPGALSGNSIDGDPDQNLARITITFTTANGLTFGANNISQVGILVAEADSAGTLLSTAVPFVCPFGLASGVASSAFDFYLRQGRFFKVIDVMAINGDKQTLTGGSLLFLAGNIISVAPGDARTVPAPVIGTITREDGNSKIDIVPITLTQDGVGIVWFKRLDFAVSINGGAFNDDKGNSFSLKAEDALYASAGASKTWNLRVKRAAGKTAQYRATAIAVRGKASATATSGVQGATTADIAEDTVAPATLGTPTLGFVAREGAVIGNMTVGTNWNRPLYKEVVIFNGATFFDLPTYFASNGLTVQANTEANSRYRIGSGKDVKTIGVRLADLIAVLGATAFAKFRATNAINSTDSASSVGLTLATAKDIMGGRNAVSKVDVGVTLATSSQLLSNGDLVGATDGGTHNNMVLSFGRLNTFASFNVNTIQPIRLSSTTSIAWNQSNNSVSVYDATWFLLGLEKNDGVNENGWIPEQHAMPGDIMSVSLYAKAPAGGIAGTIRAYLLSNTGAVIYDLYAQLLISTITSTYKLFGGKMSLSTSYFAGDKFFVLDFSQVTGINTTHPLELDGLMLLRGEQFKSYTPRVKLEGITIPGTVNAVLRPDLGSFGPQQGGFILGGGGELIAY